MNVNPQFVVIGIIWYIVFLLSTTCHEGAHALVAHLGGDPTAMQGGQVSLNPLPHIQREPFGTVLVPWITYLIPPHWMLGWASAPFDPGWAERHPHRAAWMALAGPVANFTLAGIAALGIHLGIVFGYFRVPEEATFTHVTAAVARGTPEFAATFLSIMFVLNILLGTFNLLPVPPLDGHTGITALMSEDTARRFLDWSRNQGLGIAGLLLAWVLYDRVFDYIFRISLSMLYPGAF